VGDKGRTGRRHGGASSSRASSPARSPFHRVWHLGISSLEDDLYSVGGQRRLLQINRLEDAVGAWRKLCEQCAYLAPRQSRQNSSRRHPVTPSTNNTRMFPCLIARANVGFAEEAPNIVFVLPLCYCFCQGFCISLCAPAQ